MLWLQGCLTFFSIEFVAGYLKEFCKSIHLKQPAITKIATSSFPADGLPVLAIALAVFWTVALMRLRRWRPSSAQEPKQEELIARRLEAAFAMHLGLNCFTAAMGIPLALPLIQLVGCL
jgi:hypothetical protein